jgi:hypothetical protein
LLPPTPFREEQPPLDLESFYYAQEDEVIIGLAFSVALMGIAAGYIARLPGRRVAEVTARLNP